MDLNVFYETNAEQASKFNMYMDLLLEWNKRVNLTSITNKDEIVLKHFADSLSISKYVNDYSTVIDIGTGGGFPGIPLKIYNNSLKMTLLDSLNKRIIFLNEVIKELKLDNIEAVHGRAEDIARIEKYREKYDVATSRAVSSLNILMEYMLPFVKEGGICVCMKGPNIEDEIKNSKKALNELGGEIEKIENLHLANSNIKRNIIIVRKTKKTSSKYPRKAGIPSKKPL